MLPIVGAAIILMAVFGGYVASGGKLPIILKALPFEALIIMGSAFGALLIANGIGVVSQVLVTAQKVFRGPKWRKEDYTALFKVLYLRMRDYHEAPAELESKIDRGEHADLLGEFGKLEEDTEVSGIILDAFRVALLNGEARREIGDLIENRIKLLFLRQRKACEALRVMADSLPALGIVAAVLGVIKTMAAIDQPPEVLGQLIGSALVGTFLGVFLAYAFVGPLSSRLMQVVDEEENFLQSAREVLVAFANGHPPTVCLEIGRQAAIDGERPTFLELQQSLQEAKRASV